MLITQDFKNQIPNDFWIWYCNNSFTLMSPGWWKAKHWAGKDHKRSQQVIDLISHHTLLWMSSPLLLLLLSHVIANITFLPDQFNFDTLSSTFIFTISSATILLICVQFHFFLHSLSFFPRLKFAGSSTSVSGVSIAGLLPPTPHLVTYQVNWRLFYISKESSENVLMIHIV